MIAGPQLAAMKKTAYIVNVARGGLIDEAALAEALREGRIAGAGIDVFSSEPPADDVLTGAPNIVVTPHLGASTDEAQEKAGVSVARSVRLALGGELVPDAVNVAGGAIDPFVRPGIALVEKLGQILAAVAGHGALTDLEIDVRGELAAYDVSVYRLAALKGYFTNLVTEHVSYVNAPLLAEQRGIASSLSTAEESRDYRNTTTLRGVLSDGTSVEVAGTLSGTKMVEKIIGLNGYDIEVPIAEHHVVMLYTDRPGIVAAYGREFGDAGVNIAGMQIARRSAGGQALTIVTVDSPVPDEVLERVRAAIDADEVREIDIVDA
jgi:D-3-phosphoglycerate dehydrogenase